MKHNLIADTGQACTENQEPLLKMLLEANHNYRYGNYKAAYALYKILEQQRPNGHVYYRLGVMHNDGLGIPKDSEMSNYYFQLAVPLLQEQVEKGVPESECDLGYMYEQGYGVQRDKILAVKHYKLAADKNYALAQYNFGVMVRNGQGTNEDQELALKYFHLAARTGAPWAQFNLASIYEYGTCGAKADMIQALHYYRLAADQGDCRAQYRVAKIYENGTSSMINHELAIQYWHLAYEQRHEHHHSSVCRQLQKVYRGEKGDPYRLVASRYLADRWPQAHVMINRNCQKAIVEMYLLRNKVLDSMEIVIPVELIELVARETIRCWPVESQCHFLHLVEMEEKEEGMEQGCRPT